MFTKIVISPERLQLLESHFLLFFSGMTRENSQTITPQTITDIRNKSQHLVEMGSLVAEGVDILVNENQDILDFGRLMHQSWLMKKSISSNISNSLIDGIYDTAIASGAVGGKLLGAGGGGFVVFFAPPENMRIYCSLCPNLFMCHFDLRTKAQLFVLIISVNCKAGS